MTLSILLLMDHDLLQMRRGKNLFVGQDRGLFMDWTMQFRILFFFSGLL